MVSSTDIHKNIPPLSGKIKEHRLHLAGHCLRHPELPVNKVIVWEPTHSKCHSGRPTKTMLKTLIEDAGVNNKEELISCMQDRVFF